MRKSWVLILAPMLLSCGGGSQPPTLAPTLTPTLTPTPVIPSNASVQGVGGGVKPKIIVSLTSSGNSGTPAYAYDGTGMGGVANYTASGTWAIGGFEGRHWNLGGTVAMDNIFELRYQTTDATTGKPYKRVYGASGNLVWTRCTSSAYTTCDSAMNIDPVNVSGIHQELVTPLAPNTQIMACKDAACASWFPTELSSISAP